MMLDHGLVEYENHFQVMFKYLITLGSIAGMMACAGSEKPAVATPGGSPSAAAGGPGFGVIVMAHGGGPEWDQAVLQTVAPLRAKYEIEVAFGMADAESLQQAVKKLEARNVRKIGVVRMFISGESWLERTEQIFGLREGAPPPGAAGHAGHAGHGDHHGHHAGGPPPQGAPAAAQGAPKPAGAHGGHSMAFYRVETQSAFALSSEGLADAPGMAQVLAERATALSKAPAREDVLILAHGPGDDGENERWIAKIDARAAKIRESAPFRRVQVETLREDWPAKRVVAEERIRSFVKRATTEGGTAIVLPFRVQGFGPYARVLEGLDYVSDGKGLIPHDEVGKWIERQIVEVAAKPFGGGAPAAAGSTGHAGHGHTGHEHKH